MSMIEMGTKTALEIVDIYLKKIWNEGQADLVRTYCADPITRHDLHRLAGLFRHCRTDCRAVGSEGRSGLAPPNIRIE